MDLPPYIPGSKDRRAYIVRGAGERSVGFNGSGRDGDYVPEGAPEPAVLDAMVAGLGGVTPVGACDLSVATEATLEAIEARMAEASGGAWAISREGDGTLEVARALLDAPAAADTRRMFSLRRAWSLSVEVPVEGDATATPWAWGKDPGDWLATTLAAMGVPVVVKSGSGNGATLVVPRERVRELLERGLENPLLGTSQVQRTDTRVPR